MLAKDEVEDYFSHSGLVVVLHTDLVAIAVLIMLGLGKVSLTFRWLVNTKGEENVKIA